jgi:F-type H+-transporting ATPase subunit delta
MSSLTTLARPYAKAAFELARGADALSRWDDLLGVASEIVTAEPMASLLGNPRVKKSQLIAIVSEALGEEAEQRFRDFIAVLGHNGRLPLLPEIAALFRVLRQDEEKRLSVRVVSAVPLAADQEARLKQALAKRYQRDIELQSVVDQSVLGGAVIYAGSEVIDGSLRGRLQKLQASLSR